MANIIHRYHEYISQPTPEKITITDIDLPRANSNITDTSVPLTGKDYYNYSPPVVESLIWSLGNFASDSSPINPLYGQTWFDTSENLLKVFTGEDHDNTPNNWITIKKQDLQSAPELIPDYNKLYDVGSAAKRWKNLYCDTLNAYTTFRVNSVSLADLIPSDTADIKNNTNIAGDNIKIVLMTLNTLEGTVDELTGIESFQKKSGGVMTLVPENKRYRIYADKDINITINSVVTTPSLFQIVLIGKGRINLIAGGGVTITKIRTGTYCSFANFTKQSDNNWLVHGNFG